MEVHLYPPRVLRRCIYTRLGYYGGASIPALGTTEVHLYPPRVLRRCIYTRLGYYGGASIPA